MTMHRFGYVWMAAALAVAGVSGCATKNYVRTQTQPLVEHTDQLDQKTSANNQQIHDVDSRAQAGIHRRRARRTLRPRTRRAPPRRRAMRETAANEAVHRADSLDSVVKGLDQYKQVADVSVTFGFDKAVLTDDDKEQLDTFAASLGSAKSYILEVTGGTDSTGPAQYNYDLSQRRADAVVQYLAAKYGIAPHRFYLIGIGKDQEVALERHRGRPPEEPPRAKCSCSSNMSDQSTAADGIEQQGSGTAKQHGMYRVSYPHPFICGFLEGRFADADRPSCA